MQKEDENRSFASVCFFQNTDFISESMRTRSVEKGRSLTEILLVIAVMGILSVLAIFGFRLLMNKRLANAIVYDSRMVHVDAQARVSVPINEWRDVPYSFESKKTIQTMRDAKGMDYVKVLGVEQEVCPHVLNMAVVDVVSFLNEDFTPKTSCELENNIVVKWTGIEKVEMEPEPECKTASDCGDDFDGICKDEHCVPCNATLEHPNTAKTECICDPEKALTCKNEDGDKWCCGEELICGEEKGECKDGEGKCIYIFDKPEPIKETNCSYEMTQPDSIKAANCSYEMTQPNSTKRANCKYTITNNLVDGNYVVTRTVVQGCSSGQYCYLNYKNEDCSTTLSDGSTGTLYGTCLDRTVSSTECVVAEVTGGLTPKQGCSSGQYCYLYYKDEDCSTALSDGSTGTLYGTCLDRTISSTECVITSVGGGLTQKQGCPVDEYCYLKWAGSDCSDSISDGDEGELLGACLKRNKNDVKCPIK